ncbi:MAG: hypothetical protein OXG35_11615, partial [Acidobacteria bacterium]|nr:hypothetical protein [Acidobacteriota bacterium]
MARRTGSVTTADVLDAIPEADHNPDALRGVVAELAQRGIAVRGRPSVAGPTPDIGAARTAEDAAATGDSVRAYFTEISTEPLLTAEDERRLARAIEEWRYVLGVCGMADGRPPGEILARCLERFRDLEEAYFAIAAFAGAPRVPDSERTADPAFRAAGDYVRASALQRAAARMPGGRGGSGGDSRAGRAATAAG